jgi:lauroyl/myristoyl acyltransferase
VFPHLSAKDKIRLRNRCLREFGKTYLEIAYIWLRPAQEVLGLIREVRGAELLERGDGRGLIVLSPHLGAWEVAGMHLVAQGPTTIFYKPQKYLDDLIVAARQRGGATLAPITARGIRALVQGLSNGEYAGILPDQEPRADKGAAFAPLFGIPAWTMVLVNRLARKSGARVIFMFAERLPRSAGFTIHCLPAPDGIDSDDDSHRRRGAEPRHRAMHRRLPPAISVAISPLSAAPRRRKSGLYRRPEGLRRHRDRRPDAQTGSAIDRRRSSTSRAQLAISMLTIGLSACQH